MVKTTTTMIMLTAPLSGGVGVVGVLSLWNKYKYEYKHKYKHKRHLNTTAFSGTSFHPIENTIFLSAGFLAVPFGVNPT